LFQKADGEKRKKKKEKKNPFDVINSVYKFGLKEREREKL
jgi:hypothetical protein